MYEPTAHDVDTDLDNVIITFHVGGQKFQFKLSQENAAQLGSDILEVTSE